MNFSEIKGIVSALQQIREKAQKDGLKKKEETISRLVSFFLNLIESNRDGNVEFCLNLCQLRSNFGLIIITCLICNKFRINDVHIQQDIYRVKLACSKVSPTGHSDSLIISLYYIFSITLELLVFY